MNLCVTYIVVGMMTNSLHHLKMCNAQALATFGRIQKSGKLRIDRMCVNDACYGGAMFEDQVPKRSTCRLLQS